MKTIKEITSSEIIVNKSRFIATLFPISNKEEATKFLEETRKKYFDARHNCYAYIIYDPKESTPIIKKSSDDGEPSGTAGAPILECLEGADLVNVLCVVTRYFGGVLLGTGGLTRAYSSSCKESISKAQQEQNCYQICSYYFYFNKNTNKYECTDDYLCPYESFDWEDGEWITGGWNESKKSVRKSIKESISDDDIIFKVATMMKQELLNLRLDRKFDYMFDKKTLCDMIWYICDELNADYKFHLYPKYDHGTQIRVDFIRDSVNVGWMSFEPMIKDTYPLTVEIENMLEK